MDRLKQMMKQRRLQTSPRKKRNESSGGIAALCWRLWALCWR
jgi:hypothetical protein